MNLINKTLIDMLISAAETLRNSICGTLEKYKNDAEREKRISERFKDEAQYYAEQQGKLAAIARAEIEKAERVFCAKVNDLSGQMETQLKRHLSEPVNSQFHDKLKMIADFDLLPESLEIEQLIQLNGGNQTGLSALAKTLEKVNSPYKLNYHSTKDFQNDIAEIRGLCRNLKYIPATYLHQGVEVFKGISADYVYPNGNVLHNRITFDSVHLITSQIDFETRIEKIKGLKDVWSADCSYAEADKESEEAKKIQKLTNEFLKDAGLPAGEPIEAKSATTIENTNDNNIGVEFAKQLGAEKAASRQAYDETIGMMLK